MDEIAGYTVERVRDVPGGGRLWELTHERTGAAHVHFEWDDDNDTFAVLFPTVPRDSTGVAHILEHMIFAGSRRYPTRLLPALASRSLSTFLNAMTAPAWTVYPVASRNREDFWNLTSVYLDAVFFPLLTEDAFDQEGWRLEFAEASDPRSGLRWKGVVYNEMKGAMAAPGALMGRATGRALFPGTTFAENSGGSPEHIPDLTLEQLRAFHEEHYHPSNARFFSAGRVPLAELAARVEELALRHFDRLEVDTSVPDVDRFQSPRRLSVPLAVPDGDAKGQALVGWVTRARIDESARMLALQVLTEALLVGQAAPLRRALIDSGLGSALADGTGFQSWYPEPVFGAGLKDVPRGREGEVDELVRASLKRIAEEGLDPELVDGAVDRLEFQVRERSNVGVPYGIRLVSMFSAVMAYGGDPFSELDPGPDLAAMAEARRQDGYLESLISTELLDNPHRALIVLDPDPDLERRQDDDERERLKAIEVSLDETATRAIVARGVEFAALQGEAPDPSCLPILDLRAVRPEVREPAWVQRVVAGVPVSFYPQPTAGVTYFDVHCDFAALPEALIDDLRLFSAILTQTGVAGQDHIALARRIARDTGGVGAGADVQPILDPMGSLRWLTIGGKALARKQGQLLGIIGDIMASAVFEPARVAQVLAEQRTRMEARIAPAGSALAMGQARARQDGGQALRDRLSGLGALARLRAAAETGGAEGASVRLGELHRALFSRDHLCVCVTCEEGAIEEIARRLEEVLGALPAGVGAADLPLPEPLPGRAVARTATVPVAYNARAFVGPGYEDPDAAPLQVAAHLSRSTFLWRELRERGGAYGAHADASGLGSSFWFNSYRDPHIVRTFRIFDEAIIRLCEGPVEDEDLQGAIRSVWRQLDPTDSPDSRGRSAFVRRIAGLDPELRLAHRERVLGVTVEQIREVSAKYLRNQPGVIATVAGNAKVEEALAEDPELFDVVEPV
ncbi:MAG TPA: insulinase family protein [Candidatus Dormibacteraeota bacterium]|nr:insulinase family protein [Candidatus Dormibacteraeota bacterium]